MTCGRILPDSDNVILHICAEVVIRPSPRALLGLEEFHLCRLPTSNIQRIDQRYLSITRKPKNSFANDVEAAIAEAMTQGATLHASASDVGDGIITGSVRTPSGSILGLICNPHFVA